MSSVKVTRNGDTVTITPLGSFTFVSNTDFRAAYKSANKTDRFIVDLSNASYMDSAGLGMLLQLREYVGNDRARITLRGAGPDIRSVLEVANFPSLFNVDG